MFLRKILFMIIFILSISIVGVLGYLAIILFGNYTIDETDLVMNETSTVVDQNGQTITKLFEENREMITIEEVPEHVQDAFISIEDHRFFQHTGIDFRAIGRAIYRDIATRSKAEGGSTITQQLAKNAFLTHEKSWMRKTKEVLISINLERRYSKDEILEMYLNQIYFGHGAHGIEAASKLYFDKSTSELSVEEGALLAALPKAPSHYSPFLDYERSKERRNLVLSMMQRRGYLTAEEVVPLQGRTLPTEQMKITENPAYLSYVDLLLLEAEEKHQISEEEILRGGYEIVVAMDPAMQQTTYDHFQKSETFPSSTGEDKVEGSIVLLDNETGGVVAVQGGRDYVRKGFNRANAMRQPGSVFKPTAVYAPAMEEGLFHPYSLLTDEETDFDGYIPQNLSQQYSGEITMYDALRDSVNVPAVWTLEQLGVETSKSYLQKQNIYFDDEGLGIALGGLDHGVSPLQIAASYRTFANEGMYSEPYFIEGIYDRNGELVSERSVEQTEVVSSQTAWYMTRMLEGVVEDGTGRSGEYNGPLAGKTGTTSLDGQHGGSRDLWFAGFTPEVSGAIWMGYDRNDLNHTLTESSAVPTRAFKSVLTDVNQNEADRLYAFEKPSGVDELQEPIHFVDISDLSAEVTFGFTGAQVQLDWTASEDDRLHYRVYQKKGEELEFIDEVVGESEYLVKGASLFSSTNYVVTPYNPQIDREGNTSNMVEAKFQLFSHGDAS
ncbi:penicillin-binding protein [Salipaludibacillus keqinensis]|uniref:Penicillin-binding protein n=1 Tax=Salipaludibacillus keqinensis TaxID=2045207 RepID=A0A323TG61_9BACI|nr:PBP1A family penicillin-binding protein [Salipaludibacillus keqinensis]PYZ94122.1 penicillin-binding protein [Salipaludibacillus keqinensis]